jgi:adenine-specific DNA methylase
MTLSLTEQCLYISMAGGNKTYAPSTEATHSIEIFSIKDRREVSAETIATGQSSAPFRNVMGRKLDAVTIEFPIQDMAATLAALADSRIANTPKNIFLASSILTVETNTNTTELPVGSHWFVDSFELTRSFQRRMYVGTLSLLRWYRDLPVAT